jgi:glycerol-3-phosphate dehydrogenase (NAD(P)+)
MGKRITVIGDGAMGTLCAALLAGKGCAVTVWGHLAADVARMKATRENPRLRGVKIPEAVQLTADDAALRDVELILCAVPTQYIRPVLQRLRGHAPAGVPVASVSKGIENGTLLRPTQIIVELLGPRPVVALSGPNISGELARKLPATVVAASDDDALTLEIQELFTTPFLRVYRNDDVMGVELAGAMKNVIAIAAGILDGMQAGNNAKAALLTRGLVEISRLGVELGAKPETFAGLAGLGDLVTTCVSPEGRNRSFGEKIGRGGKPAEVLAGMNGVVEGVPTTQSVIELARRMKVEMPISESLYHVLFEGKDPKAAIMELMSREPKHEVEGRDEL